MSHLIALIFDDPLRGEEAMTALRQMTRDGVLEIEDIVLVRRSLDGKMSVAQGERVREPHKSGRVLELMAAAVTGTTPRDLAAAAASRQVTKLMDHGVTRTLIAGVKSEVVPGKSALMVLSEAEPERCMEIGKKLQRFGQRMMERDVPSDLLEKIESQIEPRAA